ncbi:hypothetical protein [Streptomyces sp. NPDC052225]|uniref:hypothetical protein n=1 Tax=Streptomyces sp. NPDC052225 TaxID=3154949 RepID=UPI0034186293
MNNTNSRIQHTMIVSFPDNTPDSDVDQFLKDIEKVMRASGSVETFAANRHIRVPADEHSPVFVATAIVQIGVADRDALDAAYAVPGLEDVITHWQSRHPYQVVWANHEPLA